MLLQCYCNASAVSLQSPFRCALYAQLVRSSCAPHAHHMRILCTYRAYDHIRYTNKQSELYSLCHILQKTSQKYNAIYIHLQAICTIFVLFNLGNIHSKQMPISDDIGTHIFIIISYSFVGTTRTGQLELLISDVKNGRKRSVKNAPVFITSIATISAFVSRSASIN